MGTKGNADQQSTCRTQSRVSVEQALERMRQLLAILCGGLAMKRTSLPLSDAASCTVHMAAISTSRRLAARN